MSARAYLPKPRKTIFETEPSATSGLCSYARRTVPRIFLSPPHLSGRELSQFEDGLKYTPIPVVSGARGFSERRAESVKKYLVAHGVSESRIRSIGYGKTKPVASNDTTEGREKNRRTDIKVYPNPAKS